LQARTICKLEKQIKMPVISVGADKQMFLFAHCEHAGIPTAQHCAYALCVALQWHWMKKNMMDLNLDDGTKTGGVIDIAEICAPMIDKQKLAVSVACLHTLSICQTEEC